MPDTMDMNRRAFLAASGAMAAGLALGGPAWAQAAGKPNVVLLIIDTLRADALGCYGSTVGASEELDAIAAEGVQFMNTFAASSWTLASIGGLTTGRHPRTVGLYDTTDYLDDIAPSIAQQLQRAGYGTWSVTANAVINSVAGFGRGFLQYQDANINWEVPGKRTASSDEVFRDALKMAKSKETGTPGYLQLNIMEPHEYYRGEGKLTRPEFDGLYPEITTSASRRQYFQSVRQASIDTAKFIKDLRALPGWDDTLFVIIGDHGEGLNDHPRVWRSNSHGILLYPSNVRVPMIWHYPGGTLKAAKVYEPVSLLDIYPTLMDVAGMSKPEGLDGLSLAGVLEGKPASAARGPLVSETYNFGMDKIACHSSAWTYVHNRDLHAGCGEFELQTLAGYVDGKHTNQLDFHPDVAYRMAKHIRDWEEKHPKRAAVKVREVTDIGNRQQELEALGYL